MAESEVSATEAARRLGDLLSRVRYRGESFLIRRGRAIVAWLGPPPNQGASGRELAARWRNVSHLTPEEARAFAADVEEARSHGNLPPRAPWER